MNVIFCQCQMIVSVKKCALPHPQLCNKTFSNKYPIVELTTTKLLWLCFQESSYKQRNVLVSQTVIIVLTRVIVLLLYQQGLGSLVFLLLAILSRKSLSLVIQFAETKLCLFNMNLNSTDGQCLKYAKQETFANSSK